MSAASARAANASTVASPRPLQIRAAILPLVLGAVVLAFATLSADHAVVASLAAVALIVLSAIDIEQGIIPNRIVLPAAGVVLVAQVALFPGQAVESGLAASLAALVFAIPQLFGRAWIGMGDVKLALLLGAALGWGVLGALLIGFLCTFPVALFLLIRDGLSARSATIPLGPFLSLGALIVLFAPHLAGLSTS